MDDRSLEPDNYGYERDRSDARDARGDRWGLRWGDTAGERNLPSDASHPPYPNQRGQSTSRRLPPLYVDPQDLSILWPFRPLLSSRGHSALETFLKLAGAWEIRRDPSSRNRADVVAEALRPVFGNKLPRMQLGPGPVQLDASFGIILLLLFLLDQRLPAMRK